MTQKRTDFAKWVAIAITLLTTFGLTLWRASAVCNKVDAVEKKVNVNTPRIDNIEKENVEIKVELKYIREGIDRIESKLPN